MHYFGIIEIAIGAAESLAYIAATDVVRSLVVFVFPLRRLDAFAYVGRCRRLVVFGTRWTLYRHPL